MILISEMFQSSCRLPDFHNQTCFPLVRGGLKKREAQCKKNRGATFQVFNSQYVVISKKVTSINRVHYPRFHPKVKVQRGRPPTWCYYEETEQFVSLGMHFLTFLKGGPMRLLRSNRTKAISAINNNFGQQPSGSLLAHVGLVSSLVCLL